MQFSLIWLGERGGGRENECALGWCGVGNCGKDGMMIWRMGRSVLALVWTIKIITECMHISSKFLLHTKFVFMKSLATFPSLCSS